MEERRDRLADPPADGTPGSTGHQTSCSRLDRTPVRPPARRSCARAPRISGAPLQRALVPLSAWPTDFAAMTADPIWKSDRTLLRIGGGMLIAMIDPRWLRALSLLCAAALACGVRCGSARAGAGTVASLTGRVPCCGGSARTSPEWRGGIRVRSGQCRDAGQAGLVDAYLVSTSCAKLFDGPCLPAPLCRVYSGPATPGRVSSGCPSAGTCRLWFRATQQRDRCRVFCGRCASEITFAAVRFFNEAAGAAPSLGYS